MVILTWGLILELVLISLSVTALVGAIAYVWFSLREFETFEAGLQKAEERGFL